MHLGDNPNFYDPIKWSGLSAVLPVKISTNQNEGAVLIIETTEIQTLADWQAHRITLDGFHIGFLKETNASSLQIHKLLIPRDLIKNGVPQKLAIEVVGRGPGLEDDFILKTISMEGAKITIGWN